LGGVGAKSSLKMFRFEHRLSHHKGDGNRYEKQILTSITGRGEKKKKTVKRESGRVLVKNWGRRRKRIEDQTQGLKTFACDTIKTCRCSITQNTWIAEKAPTTGWDRHSTK